MPEIISKDGQLGFKSALDGRTDDGLLHFMLPENILFTKTFHHLGLVPASNNLFIDDGVRLCLISL